MAAMPNVITKGRTKCDVVANIYTCPESVLNALFGVSNHFSLCFQSNLSIFGEAGVHDAVARFGTLGLPSSQRPRRSPLPSSPSRFWYFHNF